MVAQNLVPNAGFENLDTCPWHWSVKAHDLTTTDWYSPTEATPDNFSECSELCGTPKNWAGIMQPHKGGAYAGLIARRNFGLESDDKERRSHREYLQVKLQEPLQAGKAYHVEFYYVLAENARLASDQLQIHFSGNPITGNYRHRMAVVPQLSTPVGKPLASTTEWQKFEGVYRARGGEEYLTLGNFSQNGSSSFEHVYHKIRNDGRAFEFSYYFLDDVAVVAEDQLEAWRVANGEVSASVETNPNSVTETHDPGNTTETELTSSDHSGHDHAGEAGNDHSGEGAGTNNAGTPTLNLPSTVVGDNVKVDNPDQAKAGQAQEYYFLTEEEREARNLGPIIRNFKCECEICNAARKEALYSKVTVDEIDSATYRVGQRIDMSKVWFELKTDKLLKESHEELDKLVFLLSELPETTVELVIHMNYFGEEEDNKDLSGKTAKALYNYLREQGVTNQILYNGYGRALTPPLDGRQRDRIIELIIRKI